MSVYTSTRWRSQRNAAPSARRRSTTSTISVPSTYWCSAFRSSAGIARSWSHGSRPSSIARRKRWFAAEYGIASSSTTKWSRCSSITKVGGRAEARLVGSTGSLEKINERCSSTFSAEPVVDSPSVAGDSPSARGRGGFVGDDGSGGSGGTGGSGGGELPSRRFLKSILNGTNSFVSAEELLEGEPSERFMASMSAGTPRLATKSMARSGRREFFASIERGSRAEITLLRCLLAARAAPSLGHAPHCVT